MTTLTQPRSSTRPLLALWLLFATALAAWAPLTRAPFLVPLMVFGTIAGGVFLYRQSASVRTAVQGLDTRALLAAHVIRAPIGIMFLFMYSAGALPGIFAVRAGVGDTLMGLGALLGIVAWKSRRYLFAWNLLGLIDIAMSVATAQKVLLVDRDPVALATVQTFPFPLIPFFVVPLVVLTHLALFSRLRATSSS